MRHPSYCLAISGIVLAGSAACATAPHSGTAVATAPSPACTQIIANARLHPDTSGYKPPGLREIRMPPVEGVPPELADKTVDVALAIDETGSPIADSIIFSPAVRDQRYASALRNSIAQSRFSPATSHGCPVHGWLQMEVTLPGRHL